MAGGYLNEDGSITKEPKPSKQEPVKQEVPKQEVPKPINEVKKEEGKS